MFVEGLLSSSRGAAEAQLNKDALAVWARNRREGCAGGGGTATVTDVDISQGSDWAKLPLQDNLSARGKLNGN